MNTFSVLPIPFWKSLNEINYIGNTHVQKTYNTELEFYLLKRSIDRRNVKWIFQFSFSNLQGINLVSVCPKLLCRRIRDFATFQKVTIDTIHFRIMRVYIYSIYTKKICVILIKFRWPFVSHASILELMSSIFFLVGHIQQENMRHGH